MIAYMDFLQSSLATAAIPSRKGIVTGKIGNGEKIAPVDGGMKNYSGGAGQRQR
jgi:hypothetical protein